MAKRPALRIAVNAGLDALLAAAAVPLADWLAAPERMPLPWFAAPAWGAVSLLLAGLPFGLSRHYWRYTGLGELVGVAAGSVLAATLFCLGLHLAGVALPSPSFPVGLALCLLVLLTFPRIGYRMTREAPPAQSGPEPVPVLLLGAGDGADLFLSTLAASPDLPYRPVGLLSGGGAQTGRRIQNCPVLGSLADAPAVLTRLRAAGDAPQALVVTDVALDRTALDGVRVWARREGLAMVQASGIAGSAPRASGFVAAAQA